LIGKNDKNSPPKNAAWAVHALHTDQYVSYNKQIIIVPGFFFLLFKVYLFLDTSFYQKVV
jgi:hypothetical protein